MVVCDWEPKRLSKVVVFQRGTHVMFSSPHRHTQPRESQTVISQQSERNEKKVLVFVFVFMGED